MDNRSGFGSCTGCLSRHFSRIDLIPDRCHTFVFSALAHAALSLALLYMEVQESKAEAIALLRMWTRVQYMKHITMSFTAYVSCPFQKTLRCPSGMLSMSFKHVFVAGNVAISTLTRVHSKFLPLIKESYQFSGDPCCQRQDYWPFGDADDFLDCFIMPASIVGGTFQG